MSALFLISMSSTMIAGRPGSSSSYQPCAPRQPLISDSSTCAGSTEISVQRSESPVTPIVRGSHLQFAVPQLCFDRCVPLGGQTRTSGARRSWLDPLTARPSRAHAELEALLQDPAEANPAEGEAAQRGVDGARLFDRLQQDVGVLPDIVQMALRCAAVIRYGADGSPSGRAKGSHPAEVAREGATPADA